MFLTEDISLFPQPEEALSLGRPRSAVRDLFWTAPLHPVGLGVRVLPFDFRRYTLVSAVFGCRSVFPAAVVFLFLLSGDLRSSGGSRRSARSLR